MYNYTMYENGIIADKRIYDLMKNTDSASILLFSDSHGEVEAVRWIFSVFGRQCDLCLFAGDGVEDILKIVKEDNGQAIAPPVLILAKGNCDCERYPLIPAGTNQQQYLSIPSYQQITVAHQHILLTHGDLCKVESGIDRLSCIAINSGCSIAVHGHTHVQSIDIIRSTVIINGGSPLRPRGKSFGGFGILSIDNQNNNAELAFYKLLQNEARNFSASIHFSYPFKLSKKY